MLTITHIDYIRFLYFEKGESFASINKTTGFNFRTIKKYIEKDDFNEKTHKVARTNKSDVLRPIINKWLEEDKSAHVKQRHTAKRIYERLLEEYPDLLQVSDRTVRTLVKEEKRKVFGPSEAYLILEHPGGEAQVDFGHLYANYKGVRRKLCYLVLSFPKSNAGFAVVTRSETREALLEGLVRIFGFLGYVPTSIWFDQMSTAALRTRDDKGKLMACEMLTRFSNHYGFMVKFCNPDSGNEKGNVENKVGTIRRNFFVPEPTINDLEAYNKELLGRCAEKNKEEHYKLKESIEKLFEEEKALMKSFNKIAFDTSRYLSARVNKQGLIRFETNLYSASPSYVGEEVKLRVSAERLDILTKDFSRTISSHRRLFEKHAESIHHLDFIDLLKARPRALKYSGIYAVLPDNWKDYLEGLEKDELRQALEVLKRILTKDDTSLAEAVLKEAQTYEHLSPDSIYLTYKRMKESREIYEGFMDMSFSQPGYETRLRSYDSLMASGGLL